MRDLPGMVDGWDLRGDPPPRPKSADMLAAIAKWEAEHQWPEDGTMPVWAEANQRRHEEIHAQRQPNILFRHREPARHTNVLVLAARRAMALAAHRITDGGYLLDGTAPGAVADGLRAVADAIEADHDELMNRPRPPLGRHCRQAEAQEMAA